MVLQVSPIMTTEEQSNGPFVERKLKKRFEQL